MNAYVFMHECSNLLLAFICQKEGRITSKVFKSMGLDRTHSRLLKEQLAWIYKGQIMSDQPDCLLYEITGYVDDRRATDIISNTP